jgi:hypothetical protein
MEFLNVNRDEREAGRGSFVNMSIPSRSPASAAKCAGLSSQMEPFVEIKKG